MELQVSLSPIVGEKRDPEIGIVKIQHEQFSICVSSEEIKKAGREKIEVGLVCSGPGMPINFLPPINRFPKSVRDSIATEVEEQLKAAAAKLAADNPGDEAAAKMASDMQASNRKAFHPPTDQEMTRVVEEPSEDPEELQAL